MSSTVFHELLLPEVCYPADEVEAAVAHGDERVLAEEYGLCSHRRLGELGKHDASHAGLGKKRFATIYEKSFLNFKLYTVLEL